MAEGDEQEEEQEETRAVAWLLGRPEHHSMTEGHQEASSPIVAIVGAQIAYEAGEAALAASDFVEIPFVGVAAVEAAVVVSVSVTAAADAFAAVVSVP